MWIFMLSFAPLVTIRQWSYVRYSYCLSAMAQKLFSTGPGNLTTAKRRDNRWFGSNIVRQFIPTGNSRWEEWVLYDLRVNTSWKNRKTCQRQSLLNRGGGRSVINLGGPGHLSPPFNLPLSSLPLVYSPGGLGRARSPAVKHFDANYAVKQPYEIHIDV